MNKYALRGAREGLSFILNAMQLQLKAIEEALNEYGTAGLDRKEEYQLEKAREELRHVAQRVKWLERHLYS